MPRSPAASIIENARYGLHAGSGERNSMRVELSLPLLGTGTRTSADSLLRAHETCTGASYPSIRRHLLDDDPERHHVVGHRERVGVTQVDLVLARTELVKAVLDGNAHGLERDDGLTAQVAHHVELREVEESRVVERRGGVVRLEDEELHLRRDVEREALV